MADSLSTTGSRDRGAGLLRSVLVICVAGVLLGVSYNWFGLQNARAWGLPWIGEDRMEMLAQMESVSVGKPEEPGGAAGDPYLTNTTDPRAVAADSPSDPNLPEIPAAGRPVQIELPALRLYVGADGALIVDAREPEEYREGHIPGAISMPYDQVVTDPMLLESLDANGRPIITYCGGGECELSLSLAYELFSAGHERVAVYMGGFPEWSDAGLPVSTGEESE